MSFLQSFEEYIQEENLFQKNDFLLLAVSGGVDSVVLCELIHQAGYKFSIAHCNFQLRGNDSIRDENFVKKLAQKYNVEIFIKTFDTEKIATERKKSIEETARDLRYEWFYELISEEEQRQRGNEATRQQESTLLLKGHPTSNLQLPTSHIKHHTSYILTAHHANDNIETVLMNFFRGTGIKGMRGILPKQHQLIRPLLFATRKEIENFSIENKLEFVQDHTNAENEFTRNYFRNELIPSIQKVFPNMEENMLKNIHRFSEIDLIYHQSLIEFKNKLLEKKGNEIHIPVLKLFKCKPIQTIVYEIIKDFGFSALQTNDVIALLQSESGKYVQSETYRVIRNRKWLIISPNKSDEISLILIENINDEINFPLGKIETKKLLTENFKLSVDPLIAMLDAKEINFPLILRKWKQGDYFYPLGMNKKKKLSRFFIDQKLSLTEKENRWVIEMDKKIIWIVGMRIDNRFKVLDSTKEILQIKFQPK